MNNHYLDLWVEKYRPSTLADLVIAPEIRNHFESLNEDAPHLLFYGSPGIGKTTLAKILVKTILKCQYLYINASDENGIDTIRNKVISFAQTRSLDGKKKVVILDEADGLTGESLRILRNVMDDFTETTRFVLTANYFNRIIEPIRSRCSLFKLQPDLKGITQRCIEILKSEKISVPEDQRFSLLKLIEKNSPDMRRIINDLQKYSVTRTLCITEENQFQNFAADVVKDLLHKTPISDIRKKIIEMEKSFNSDFQQLMKEIFEIFYKTDIKENVKKAVLFNIGEHMYRDNNVVDKEINFFCCLITLENDLK